MEKPVSNTSFDYDSATPWQQTIAKHLEHFGELADILFDGASRVKKAGLGIPPFKDEILEAEAVSVTPVSMASHTGTHSTHDLVGYPLWNENSPCLLFMWTHTGAFIDLHPLITYLSGFSDFVKANLHKAGDHHDKRSLAEDKVKLHSGEHEHAAKVLGMLPEFLHSLEDTSKSPEISDLLLFDTVVVAGNAGLLPLSVKTGKLCSELLRVRSTTAKGNIYVMLPLNPNWLYRTWRCNRDGVTLRYEHWRDTKGDVHSVYENLAQMQMAAAFAHAPREQALIACERFDRFLIALHGCEIIRQMQVMYLKKAVHVKAKHGTFVDVDRHRAVLKAYEQAKRHLVKAALNRGNIDIVGLDYAMSFTSLDLPQDYAQGGIAAKYPAVARLDIQLGKSVEWVASVDLGVYPQIFATICNNAKALNINEDTMLYRIASRYKNPVVIIPNPSAEMVLEQHYGHDQVISGVAFPDYALDWQVGTDCLHLSASQVVEIAESAPVRLRVNSNGKYTIKRSLANGLSLRTSVHRNETPYIEIQLHGEHISMRAAAGDTQVRTPQSFDWVSWLLIHHDVE